MEQKLRILGFVGVVVLAFLFIQVFARMPGTKYTYGARADSGSGTGLLPVAQLGVSGATRVKHKLLVLSAEWLPIQMDYPSNWVVVKKDPEVNVLSDSTATPSARLSIVSKPVGKATFTTLLNCSELKPACSQVEANGIILRKKTGTAKAIVIDAYGIIVGSSIIEVEASYQPGSEQEVAIRKMIESIQLVSR